MTTPPVPGFFDQAAALAYDERNQKLAAISENLHFLIRLVLSDLPENARVLCLGVGTGAELLSLARAYPRWRFVGVDPSQPMLDVCRARLREAGVADRCELIAGYVRDLPAGDAYDAVLSVLVAHFIARAERADYFRDLTSQLRDGGTLVNVEMGYDLEAPAMIAEWAKIQQLMGGTPEKLAALPQVLREVLTVLPPAETQRLIRESGIAMPIPFFQSLLIQGWFGKK
jgi:tRNA (cmo5U34)-methyltransferase